jgi:N-acetylglucosamine-6-phosphate deacetylase
MHTFSLHGRVLTDGRELPPSRVQIVDGLIVAVRPQPSSNGADLVVGNGWIVPGLIDLQVNGAGGVDLTSAAEPEHAVDAVARKLAAHGVTAFCPTIVSAPPETILERLPAFRPRVHASGATSLGAHIEGPFISSEFRGIHDPRWLRPANPGEIAGWLTAGSPTIVTLAPELPGALAAIEQLIRAGVVVSLGHSGADVVAARAGLAAGARLGTHLFNGMPPLHHRRPGLVGALLASTATLGLIADGIHIDPLMLELVVRLAGPGRVALVSDALAPAGCPPGPSVLGDQPVESDGRVARRADGTLAGTVMLLDTGLRNLREWLPWLAPAEIVQMATQTPAEALGSDLAAHKGRVQPGYDADLTILDNAWKVLYTVVQGDIVRAENAALAG